MNKLVLPSLCAAAALTMSTSPASIQTLPTVKNQATHFFGYLQQDPDSEIQTESDSEGDYNVFYDRLAPEGRWFNSGDYGYVWQPNIAVSETSWRPYSDGHWVWTDRGWFWESNENFGWATYHYGRWILVDGVGWVWVPGQRWAPAWVSWRHTDDDSYVGWAPLPPETVFNVSVGVQPWCDSYYDIGPTAFAFIRIGDFCRPSYRQFCVPPQQNLVFFNRTTNITNITYNNNVINTYGPQYQRISQLTQQQVGQQVPNYRINYAAQTQTNVAFKTSVQGNQLNVIAPPSTLKAVATVKPPVAKELGKAEVDRGWRNVPQAQAQQLREQYTQKSPVPKNLPLKPVPPPKPQIQAVTKGEQHPANEPGKAQQPPKNTELKPFVQKPANETPVEKQKLETERKTAQPEKVKPGEEATKPPVAREKTERAAIPTERPKTEARKAETEHPQRESEAKHAPPTVKQPGREEAPAHKKEETKKEPSGIPQAKASHKTEQRQSHPQAAEAHGSQPHVAQAHVSQPHVSPPHVSQPHVAQTSHPKSNPPPPKKKEEHKG
ncbi:MAG: hypothetical protein JO066_04305 [Verrucomicrobia bacterium]|nr:hypothetical protein [Verrucomicrobiota bacterium]